MRKPRHGHRNKRKFEKAYEVFQRRLEEDRLAKRVEDALRRTSAPKSRILPMEIGPGDYVRDTNGNIVKAVPGVTYGPGNVLVARQTPGLGGYNVSKGKWVR